MPKRSRVIYWRAMGRTTWSGTCRANTNMATKTASTPGKLQIGTTWAALYRPTMPMGYPVTIHPSSQARWKNFAAGAGDQSSSGEFHNESWLNINIQQTGHQEKTLKNIPKRLLQDYAKSPTRPAIHAESLVREPRSIRQPAISGTATLEALDNLLERRCRSHLWSSRRLALLQPRRG